MGNQGDQAASGAGRMQSVAVDPAALADEAAAIRTAITTLFDETGDRLSLMPAGGLGSTLVTSAFDAFLQAWSSAVADLTDDVSRLADSLAVVAQWYGLTESEIEAVMAGRGAPS